MVVVEKEGPDVTREGSDAAWQRAGAHMFRIERPDVFFLRLSGELAAQDMGAIRAAFEEGLRGAQHAFWLVDATHLGAVTREARAFAARSDLHRQLEAIATFGASFTQRVVVTMVGKAVKLFQKSAPPMEFFDTEAEARAWLEALRAPESGRD